MVKKIFFALFFLYFITLLNSTIATAQEDIEITANATNHTVVFPYEKSFRFVVSIKNNSNQTIKIRTGANLDNVPQSWHVLTTTGQYELAPGQLVNYTAVFEPSHQSQEQFKPESTIVPFDFNWEPNGHKRFDVTVITKFLPFRDLGQKESQAQIKVLDKTTKKPIPNALVTAMLPSGMESELGRFTNNAYSLKLPSGNYLKELEQQYSIDHANAGYFLQISAEGFQGYFESNYLPPAGSSEKVIYLEPLSTVGNYSLLKSISSGYSIWWIRTSKNNEVFAFSQGRHPFPGEVAPEQTKVIATDRSGKVLWENATKGECWGLDVSSDGNYVAAGCDGGMIYVWNRSGQEIYSLDVGENNSVRWVEFSPDSKFLLTGPLGGSAEDSGLIDIQNKKVVWTVFTGDWLREGTFSPDSKTAYFASANGALHAVDTSTGEVTWQAAANYVIPFMLGIPKSGDVILTTGKGRIFTAIDIRTGETKWNYAYDQTGFGEVAEQADTFAAATVGGMVYYGTSLGSVTWARNYGGIGHNGVSITADGKYVLFGGPNPTLMDDTGNVLWVRSPDQKFRMTGPGMEKENGANVVWLSDDAKLMIIGQDNGDIVFYRGDIINSTNTYNQATGPFQDMELTGFQEKPFKDAPADPALDDFVSESTQRQVGIDPIVLMLILIGVTTLVLTGGIIVVLIKKRGDKDGTI